MISTPAATGDSTPDLTPAPLNSAFEAADVLRADLLQIERALRVVSQEAADLAPMLAARLNAAAHLTHNAAAALLSDLPPHGD